MLASRWSMRKRISASAHQRLGGKLVVFAGYVVAQVRPVALSVALGAEQGLNQGHVVDSVIAALADPAGQGRRARGCESGCGPGGGAPWGSRLGTSGQCSWFVPTSDRSPDLSRLQVVEEGKFSREKGFCTEREPRAGGRPA